MEYAYKEWKRKDKRQNKRRSESVLDVGQVPLDKKGICRYAKLDVFL